MHPKPSRNRRTVQPVHDRVKPIFCKAARFLDEMATNHKLARCAGLICGGSAT